MSPTFRHWKQAVWILLICAATALRSAQGAQSTWVGGGADFNWSTAGNWNPSGAPASDVNATDLIFAGSTRLTPDMDMAWSVHSITFDNTASPFTLGSTGGNLLTTGSGGITNNSTNLQTISTNIQLGGDQTFNATSGALVFNNSIDLNGHTLTISGAKNVDFNGVLSNTGFFTQSSTGTTSFNVANTFTGSRITVNSGTLQETVAGGLPDNQVYILNGGTLLTNGFSLTMGALNGNAGANLNLGIGTLTIDLSGAPNTYAGNITASAIVITGSGTQILSGSNNYGNTTIDTNATLQIGTGQTTGNLGTGNVLDNGHLVFDLESTLTVNNNISGTGTLEQQGLSTGTLILTGTNSYSGTTTTDVSTILQIGNGGTSGTLGTGNVIDNGGLAFNRSDTIVVDNTISGGGIVLQSGTGTVILTSTGGPNTYSGGTTINAGGTLQMGNADTTGTIGTGAVTDNGTLAFDRSDATSVAVSNSISGSGGIHQLGTATIALTGTNSYSGTTLIDAGTSLDVGNGGASGTLGTGTVTDNGTLIFDRSDGLTVSAAIQGLGAVHQVGAGTTTLLGTNTYSGLTTIDANTTLQIGAGGTAGTLGAGAVTNNGTLAFDHSDALSVSNTISGSGVLNQIGSGTTTITGIVSQTNTIIDAGQLNVDSASFNSPVTVNSAGTLGGVGTITGNVSNFGTVAPGNTSTPLGTLTVNGGYTHDSGATIQATIDSSGNSSVLNATGTATLNGGTVNVVSTTGSANAGTKYTFLTASSVTGTFTNATTENLPSELVPVLGYTSDSAFFTLLRNGETYEAVGHTFNQRAVGHYLDQIAPTASGDLQTVFDSLNSIDDPSLRTAMDQMSGAVHGTLGQIGVDNTTMLIAQLAQRLRSSSFTPCGGGEGGDPYCPQPTNCCCAIRNGCSLGENLFAPIQSNAEESPWTGWAQGFGLGGSAKADGNADGIKYDAGGTIAGIERWVDDTRLLGFYGGYVGTGAANTAAPNDSINGGNFGGYLYTDDGFNYYILAGGFEFDSYNTNRTLNFGDIDRLAKSSYFGWQGYTYLERGLSFESCNTVLQPFAALQYVYLGQGSFTETGADSIDLTTGGLSTNSLRSLLGARLQYAILQRNGRRSMPEIHAYWMHEYLDSHTVLDATFSPVPTGSSGFGVHGLDMGRDWAVVGASFTWELCCNWSMFVNYDAQVNNQQTVELGSGGLSHLW